MTVQISGGSKERADDKVGIISFLFETLEANSRGNIFALRLYFNKIVSVGNGTKYWTENQLNPLLKFINKKHLKRDLSKNTKKSPRYVGWSCADIVFNLNSIHLIIWTLTGPVQQNLVDLTDCAVRIYNAISYGKIVCYY